MPPAGGVPLSRTSQQTPVSRIPYGQEREGQVNPTIRAGYLTSAREPQAGVTPSQLPQQTPVLTPRSGKPDHKALAPELLPQFKPFPQLSPFLQFPRPNSLLNEQKIEEILEFPTYLINLKRRKDCLSSFTNKNPEITNYKILEAVDGTSLFPDHKICKLFEPNDFHWNCGMIGCTLSHMKIWEMVANSKDFIFSSSCP